MIPGLSLVWRHLEWHNVHTKFCQYPFSCSRVETCGQRETVGNQQWSTEQQLILLPRQRVQGQSYMRKHAMSLHRFFPDIFVISALAIVNNSLFVHVMEGEYLMRCVIIQPVERVLDPA
jgi:hypothetical protein